MIHCNRVKRKCFAVFHLIHLRFFFQQIQHPIPAGQSLVQIVRKAGQRRNRPKRTHHCHDRNHRIRETKRSRRNLQSAHYQADPCCSDNHKIRHCSLPCFQRLQTLIRAGKNRRFLLHLLPAGLSLIVLKNFIHPPQIIQYHRIQFPELIPVLSAPAAPQMPVDQRNYGTCQQVADQRQHTERNREVSDKNDHHNGSDNCNSNRRNGMRVKNFQQFNIRSDHGNQIAALFAFQLCRSQPAQGRKHLVPNLRQQFERDIMIARLLRIPQKCPRQRQHNQNHRSCPQRERAGKIHCGKQPEAAHNRQK